MIKTTLRVGSIALYVTLAVAAIASPALAADDEAALRQRVQSRSAAVVALLTEGTATEELDGLLKGAGQLTPQQQQLILAENADRRAIFALIAVQHHMPVGNVATIYATRAQRKFPPVTLVSVGPCRLVPAKSADATRLLINLKQGMNYASQRKFEQALLEFQSAAAIDKNFLGLHQNIGSAQLELRRNEEAEASFKMELALADCLSPLADTQLATFGYFMEVPEQEPAKRLQAQAEKLKAELPRVKATAYFNLACVYSLQKRKDLVLSALQSAVDAGFTDRTALATEPDLSFARRQAEFGGILAKVKG